MPPKEDGHALAMEFHTRAVLSQEAVTMCAPSGLNGMRELTTFWCPSGTIGTPCHRSSRSQSWSPETVTMHYSVRAKRRGIDAALVTERGRDGDACAIGVPNPRRLV